MTRAAQAHTVCICDGIKDSTGHTAILLLWFLAPLSVIGLLISSLLEPLAATEAGPYPVILLRCTTWTCFIKYVCETDLVENVFRSFHPDEPQSTAAITDVKQKIESFHIAWNSPEFHPWSPFQSCLVYRRWSCTLVSQEIKYALPKSIPNKGKTVHSLNVFQHEGFIVYFKPVCLSSNAMTLNLLLLTCECRSGWFRPYKIEVSEECSLRRIKLPYGTRQILQLIITITQWCLWTQISV